MPLLVQESLNQKFGFVKTFPVPELVYMEVFVIFDQELDSNERNIHTDNFENLTQLKLRITLYEMAIGKRLL